MCITALGALTPTLIAPGCIDDLDTYDGNGACPNPIPGRRVRVLDQTFVDPCCQLEDCPGHDPWKAADASTDSSTPETTSGSSAGTGGSSPKGTGGSSTSGPSSSTGSSSGAGGNKDAACGGICAPKPPPGWSGPFLFWTGPPGSAPPCPTSAPQPILMNGYGGLVAPPATCGACTCSTPHGTCGTLNDVAVGSGACPYKPATDTRTPLLTPTDGSGVCTPTTKFLPGASCNGKPCAHSVTIGPLSMKEEACAPTKVAPDQVPAASWSLEAQGCAPVESSCGACSAPGTTCVPRREERGGRALCAFTFGDEACGPPWEDRHLFYRSLADSRGCSSCGCSAPTGGECRGRLTLFQDSACKTPLVTVVVTSGSTPVCHTFGKLGPAIGSMEFVKAAYTSGTCPVTGGAPVGSAKATAPLTVCCAPM